MMAQTVWFLVFFSAAIASPAATVFLERGGGGVWESAIILRPEEFDRPRVEQLSQAFIKSHSKFNLLKFSVFTDKSDAGATLWGQHSHFGFDSWSHWFAKHARSRPAMAEIIAIGRSVIMRLRYADGRIVRTQLKGDDPLQLVVLGSRLEILYVVIHSATPEMFNSKDIKVDFLIKAIGPISPQVARGLLYLLRQSLSIPNVGIRVRNDSWFLDFGLPYVYPFEVAQMLPSREEYLRSLHITCFSSVNAVSCSQFRP